MNKLREVEILLNQGATVAVISKKIGVSDYTYYRWRKEYGGMMVDQARWLKELEQEKSRNFLGKNNTRRYAIDNPNVLVYASTSESK